MYIWELTPQIPHLLEPLVLGFSSKQPDEHTKAQKEGIESEQFWELLGGKSEYPSQKIKKDGESDPHLFSCTFSNGKTICQHMFPLCFLNPRIEQANEYYLRFLINTTFNINQNLEPLEQIPTIWNLSFNMVFSENNLVISKLLW